MGRGWLWCKQLVDQVVAIPLISRKSADVVLKAVLPHFRCRVKLRLKHPKAVLALSEARNLPVHTSAA
jgi:hypothetical protein